MINILYVGNYLKSKRNNVSTIHTLGGLLENEGYRLYYTSNQKNKALRMLDMIRAVLVRKNIIDLVVIDTYSTLNFYYTLIISQLCRAMSIPYITNLNGGNLPMRLEKNQKFSALIFKNAFNNVAPSRYLYDAFMNANFKKITYIPNTISIEKYPFSDRSFDNTKLLWVRSFSKIYNPKMAIKVLNRLKEEGYDAELCMVGPDSDGSLASAKELAKKYNLNVRFTGKLPKDEWTALAKDYNIFINTTNFDNTPVSVIEAMAMGLPIISTNVGGMPYLIENENHGLLVDKNDVKAMVEAIMRVMNSEKLRSKLIDNARIKAESFDWQVVKQQWNSVLSSVSSQNN